MADTGSTHIGPYEIRRRIGRGGMAAVYAAWDPTLQREVAVKVLSPAMTPDAVLRERFVREAKVNLRLDHTAILPIHSLGEADDSVYIVMTLATGGSLERRLHDGPLPPDEAVRIIGTVAAGLDHAHARGVVHRDLKPGNILFDEAGNPLITDFGIARFQGDASTRLTQGVTIGTPLYLSPEQARGETVSGQTDIYALAIMSFELLTGAPPFPGDTPVQVMYRHLTDALPQGGLSEPVYRVIARGASKQPGDRYTTAGAFAQALQEAVAKGEPTFPLPPGPARPPVAAEYSPADRTAAGSVTVELPRATAPPFEPAAAAPKRAGVKLVIGTLIAAALALAAPAFGFGSYVSLVLLAAAGTALLVAGMLWLVRGPVADAAAPAPPQRSGVTRPEEAPPPPAARAGPGPVRARSHVLGPGEQLAEYRILERLDDGDRTRVYHAFDERRERDVAVRVIPIDDEAPDRVQRLRREAALLGRLHHAHIVPFFDFGSTDGASYIVMPLLGGHSLATRIRASGAMPVDATLELTRQIAGALHYLHGQGIVSRDLKPGGLVFDRHDNLYLADLRIAKDLAEPEDVRLTMVGQPLGTPTYMSPEQFLGAGLTPAADQYILGCLVFEMLAAARPFEADSPFALMLKHVREDPPPLCQRRAGLPAALDDVIATALAKDPARRYRDILAFHDALVAACTDAGSEAPSAKHAGHVFISYSREDGDFAHRLADELRARGLNVWIDARIEPSDQWWRVIVEAIDTCAAFVAVMSPHAQDSKWVEREVLLADQRGKPPFPLLLSGQAFPIYVGTQYVDVRGDVLPPEAFFERLGRVAGSPSPAPHNPA